MGKYKLGKELFEFPLILSNLKKRKFKKNAIIKKVQPGDLLIVKTPGLLYSFGRRLTRNTHDHIAVVLNNYKTLNIVVPKTIIRPIFIFIRPKKEPILLRPQWKNLDQRNKFISEIKKFKASVYNIRKTILGIILTTFYSWLGIRIPMKKLRPSAKKWICTEAILNVLLKVLPCFKKIERVKLDYHSIGFATINDFLRISQQNPEILKIIYPN